MIKKYEINCNLGNCSFGLEINKSGNEETEIFNTIQPHRGGKVGVSQRPDSL